MRKPATRKPAKKPKPATKKPAKKPTRKSALKKPTKPVSKRSRAARATPSFDFRELERLILAASREAFAEVTRAHGANICAFALYSDSGAMTVCPAFDLATERDQRRTTNPDDAPYYTYSPPEWALEGVGADDPFEAICTRVREYVLAFDDDPTPVRFTAFAEQLFETCLRALEALREEGTIPSTMLAMFAVSDAEQVPAVERARVARLNPGSKVVSDFAAWTRTWGG